MITALLEQFGVIFDAWMQIALLHLEYVKALAWPLMVVGLAIAYRRPLISLLYRLRKANVMGFVVETEARELAVEAQVASLAESVRQMQGQIASLVDDHVADAAAGPPNPDHTESATHDVTHEDAQTKNDRLARARIDAEALEADRLAIARAAALNAAAEEEEEEASRLRLLEARSRNRDITSSREILMADGSRWSFNELLRSGATIAEVDRVRIEEAWLRLQKIAGRIGPKLGLISSESSPRAVVQRLYHQGFVGTGTARVANRLTRLYGAISESVEIPSEETVGDFVAASNELLSVMSTMDSKLSKGQDDLVN